MDYKRCGKNGLMGIAAAAAVLGVLAASKLYTRVQEKHDLARKGITPYHTPVHSFYKRC